MRYQLTLLFLLSFSNHIFAADSGCHKVSSIEQKACLEREFAIADKALNTAYKQALTKLLPTSDVSPDQRQRLILSQRAWLNYRDAHCAYEALQGGNLTWQAIFLLICETELTVDRTKWLKIQ